MPADRAVTGGPNVELGAARADDGLARAVQRLFCPGITRRLGKLARPGLRAYAEQSSSSPWAWCRWCSRLPVNLWSAAGIGSWRRMAWLPAGMSAWRPARAGRPAP